MNPLIASQISGPYAQSLIDGLVSAYSSDYDESLEYWNGLTLDDWRSGTYSNYWTYLQNVKGVMAQELQFIGFLIGVPWLSAPVGAIGGNTLTFNTVYSASNDPAKGFSSYYDDSGATRGIWPSFYPSSAGEYIPAKYYVLLLQVVAYLKWNGLTIESIDYVCNIAWGNNTLGSYTISFVNGNNININLNNSPVGDIAYILGTAFSYFTTDPQITVTYTS